MAHHMCLKNQTFYQQKKPYKKDHKFLDFTNMKCPEKSNL